MGRLLWSLRRPAFYGVITLIYSVFRGVSFKTICISAFPSNSSFNYFYSYLFWSTFALFVMIILSILYAKYWGDEDSAGAILGKYFMNDIISPVFCILQLPMGIILRLMGDEVDWFGCFFDFCWTIAWIIYIVHGVVNYI